MLRLIKIGILGCFFFAFLSLFLISIERAYGTPKQNLVKLKYAKIDNLHV